MSTKIYNGFCMKSLSSMQILEFTKELREIMVDVFAKQYRQLCAQKLVDTVDELKMLDHEKKFDLIEKYLISLYQQRMSVVKTVNTLNSGYKLPEKSVGDIVKYFSPSYYSIKTLCREIVDEKIKATELSPTILNQDYWIHASVVLFPLSKTKMLFASFGDALTRFLLEICESNTSEHNAFCEKYGLQEYHYQNSTDKPNNISNREWNIRAKNWSKVWSGPANQSGISITILDADMFLYNMCLDKQNRDDYVLEIKGKEERVAKIARDNILQPYCKKYATRNNIEEMQVSDYSHAFRAFDKDIKDNNAEIMFELEKEKEKLSNILIDIDGDVLKRTTLPMLIQNYMESIQSS